MIMGKSLEILDTVGPFFLFPQETFLFLFFFFFQFYFIFKLYIIVLVLPNIKMNHIRKRLDQGMESGRI